MGGVEDQIISLFKSKHDSKPELVKTEYGGGEKESEENKIKSRINLFQLKRENEAIKELKIE